jgi:hypothetical protein
LRPALLACALLLAGCERSERPAAPATEAGIGGASGAGGSWEPKDASASTGGRTQGGSGAAPLDAAGLDPGYAWLFDDSAWKPLANTPCDLREADLAKVRYPGHAWTPCGSGCRRATVLPGSGVEYRGAKLNSTGARQHGGDIQVFLLGGVRFPPAVALAESFALGTDAPASLLALYGDNCLIGFTRGRGRTFGILLSENFGGDGTEWWGLAPLSPGEPIVWPQPPRKLKDYSLLDFEGGWGAMIALSSLAVGFDLTSTDFQTVFSSPAYQRGVRARGEAVVWADWTGGRAVLRGWTAKGGSRVLAQGPWDVVNLDVSDTRLVWVGGTGPDTLSGSQETARLYWSWRKLDPDEIDIQSSVELPVSVSANAMATHGKWAAIRKSGILVADLEANALWRIPNQDGHLMDVLAISDSELLLADNSSGIQTGQHFDDLVRYDLSKLADYAEKLP